MSLPRLWPAEEPSPSRGLSEPARVVPESVRCRNTSDMGLMGWPRSSVMRRSRFSSPRGSSLLNILLSAANAHDEYASRAGPAEVRGEIGGVLWPVAP